MGFNGVSKEGQWVFEGSLKEFLRIFQGSFQGVSRKIEGCSESSKFVSKGF